MQIAGEMETARRFFNLIPLKVLYESVLFFSFLAICLEWRWRWRRGRRRPTSSSSSSSSTSCKRWKRCCGGLAKIREIARDCERKLKFFLSGAGEAVAEKRSKRKRKKEKLQLYKYLYIYFKKWNRLFFSHRRIAPFSLSLENLC